MKISLQREYGFTPEWNDNLNEEEPVEFHLRHLTTEEVDGIITLAGEYDRKEVFKKSVKTIEHLEVDGKPVKTADDVLKTPGLAQLYYEVIGFILRNMNPVQDSKNS